jgi:hypothetical protein
LKSAVAAYRAALKELTQERALDWAMTQMNLGSALASLGAGESGAARLEEAVLAYREALKETTRERVPLHWVMSTGNQGVAMMLLAERKKDVTMAEAALDHIEAARSRPCAPAAMDHLRLIMKRVCPKPAPFSPASRLANTSPR